MSVSEPEPGQPARDELPRTGIRPGHTADHELWAPPVYAVGRRGLTTPAKLVISFFTVAVVLIAAVVAVDQARTVSGQALSAPGGADQAAKNKAQSAPSGKVHESARNPILGEGVTLADVTCELPAIGRSAEELTAFYRAQIVCLEAAWNPVLAKVNEPSFPVKLQVTLPDQSVCGDAPDSKRAVAYYCPGDLAIYAPRDWMLSAVGTNRGSHLATIAHEYGHHIQNSSGMLGAISEKMNSPGETSADDLERVRRIELQANCFGALFIAATAGRGSISVATANAAIADYGNTSDSETHGSRKHQLSWARAGFDNKTTAACNTFAVSPAEVS